jgi:hypothetical protein
MQTKELFLKDPLTWTLVNEGVSSNNTDDLDTLRFELESFVCEGEYLNGMRRILQGYRDSFNGPSRRRPGSVASMAVANRTWPRSCATCGSTLRFQTAPPLAP